MNTISVRKTFAIIFSVMLFGFINAQTLKDAMKFTNNEQFEKGASAFKQIIQREPNNGDNWFWFGENYFSNGERVLTADGVVYFKSDYPDSAQALYRKGADVNPANPLNYVGLGKILWNMSKPGEANQQFFKATTIVEDKTSILMPQQKAVVYMKIAECYIISQEKEFTKANSLLAKAEALDPKNSEIFILKGDAVFEQNNANGTDAIMQYKKAAELDKASVEAILRIGQLYGRARNYPEALKYYQDASKIDSGFAPAYREKAELYYRAGQYNSAIGNYEKYLQLNSGSLSAKTRYASFLFLAKKYQDALNVIKEIQLQDSTINFLNRLSAYCYYESAAHPKDSVSYKNGLKFMEKFFSMAAPEKILASDYEYYGKILSKLGKDSLAIMKLRKAIESDTTKSELYGEIGNVYYKMKKYPDAIINYNKKISSGRSTSVNDYNYLGRAYYFNQQFSKADTAFIELITRQPDLALGYLWRGKVNAQLDPKNEKYLAKEFYEVYLLKLKPEEKDRDKKDIETAYAYLGYYYLVKKDYGASKFCWQNVKELNVTKEKQKQAADALNEPNVKAAAPRDITVKQ